MGKTLNEYFIASWRFLATIFVIAVIIVLLRLFSKFPSIIQYLLTFGGVFFVAFAGWSIVRNYGFNLKQVVLVGLLLSFGSHWSVPIFHRAWEVLYFILINSIILSIAAVFGGWLLKKFKKYS
ncbi:MAG: hypothetical protein GTO16_04235 [Candidatus Aminicenantes bacterium]|nr:hypothetical protein [Candidatus Aminicenantes bacterium]